MNTVPVTNSITAPVQSSGPSAPSAWGCPCLAACRVIGIDSTTAISPSGTKVANMSLQTSKCRNAPNMARPISVPNPRPDDRNGEGPASLLRRERHGKDGIRVAHNHGGADPRQPPKRDQVPKLLRESERHGADGRDHDPDEEDVGVAVTVAQSGHQHHQPAQHHQVDDHHPRHVADRCAEVLRQRRNRQRHRQARKLNEHVRRRQSDQHVSPFARRQERSQDTKDGSDHVYALFQ